MSESVSKEVRERVTYRDATHIKKRLGISFVSPCVCFVSLVCALLIELSNTLATKLGEFIGVCEMDGELTMCIINE